MFVSGNVKVSDETISDLVLSLPEIGSGTCRIVYDLGDVVLKVNRGHRSTLHGSCETEASHWEMFRDTEHADLFAPVLASGDGWLIMAKADRQCESSDDYYEVMRSANRLGITDLFHANCGMFGDEVKVIDYATGHVNGCEMSYSELWECECGDHNCSDCYPDGCECCCSLHNWEGCESFEGCRAEMCEDPKCFETATVHYPESAEWFGFIFGVISQGWNAQGQYVGMVRFPELEHWCTRHAQPISETVKPQILGQRAFHIHGSRMSLPWEPTPSNPF